MRSTKPHSSPSKPSPQAVLLFLKHAALDREWGTAEIRKTLGVDASTAKEIASQFQLMGYAEPVPRKPGAWRNTKAGNLVAGVRPPRLTKAKAEELLTDLTDRADAYNLKADAPVRIVKIIAFGGINGKHEKIQDVDLGVQIEPRGEGSISKADQVAAFKESTSPVQQGPAAPPQSGGARVSAAKTLLITAASLCVLWLLGVLVALVLDRP